MSTLNPRYWRLFETYENMGAKLSSSVGGVGKDASEDLKKTLSELFKEWNKEWVRTNVKPKRKKK